VRMARRVRLRARIGREMEFSADRKQVIFTCDLISKWSDGADLNADDVVFI
jgi:ABC-type transport system substrate-binding protein